MLPERDVVPSATSDGFWGSRPQAPAWGRLSLKLCFDGRWGLVPAMSKGVGICSSDRLGG